jgi:hypothetical protein
MGYTHYWRFNVKRGAAGTASKNEKAYQNAIRKCAKVVRFFSTQFGGLAGYTAHDVSLRYGGLNVNGASYAGKCEDFIMREHLSQNEAFGFCKTRQYPYDTVVTACLLILKHYLKSQIEITSDDTVSDWVDGLELAQKVLGLKSLRIPDSISPGQTDRDRAA